MRYLRDVGHVVDLGDVVGADLVGVGGELEDLAAVGAHVLEVALHGEPHELVVVVVGADAADDAVGLGGEDLGGGLHGAEGADEALGHGELRVGVEDRVLGHGRGDRGLGDVERGGVLDGHADVGVDDARVLDQVAQLVLGHTAIDSDLCLD